ILDTNDGSYFRFVIPIDAASEYLVRDTSETKTLFRLFRVPLRTAAKSVNATEGTWRFIKHLRMTLVSEPTPQVPLQNFVFARMRIVGARWTKRDVHGISTGLLGDQPSPTGSPENFQVGPVSRLTDSEYAAPAGIRDELQDPSQRFGTAGVEFNEKSLRLSARLAPDERAEVYFRYPQQSRAFLQYRQLRLWALARKGLWGQGGDLEFLIKAGNDPRNYYLYRSPLKPVQAGAVNAADWLPELTIEFDRWFELREQAEQLLATGVTAPAGQSLAVWSADSTYAIVFEDRARAPNLAAMRELSFAVYNGGAAFTEAELWLDDMRLSAPFKDPGTAGIVNLDIKGGDFLNASLTYANQGAVFRQLNQDPRYQTSGDFSLSTTAQLGQMLPSGWGVDLPVSVVHTSSALNPMFLEGTDIRATGLQGLRETGANATRVAVALRKRTPAGNPWLGLLVDGLAMRFGYTSADNSSTIARNDARGIDAGVSYARELKQRSFDIVPGFMEAALRALFPARIEQSDFFKRLTGSRLRWSPERVSFGTSYFDQERRLYQFNRVLELPTDTLPLPIESPREGLDNDALIVFAPFQPMRASLSFRSARDLLATERASTRTLERSAIAQARSELAGFDIGWERNRSMVTDVSYRPIIAPWLRPLFNYTARYGTDRNPSYLEVSALDSSALMQRRFQADRTVRRGLQLEPAGFIGTLLGLPEQGFDSLLALRSTAARLSHRLLRAWQPVDLNWNTTLGSQFERERRLPGFGYQFGLGDFDAYRLIGGDTAVFVNSRDVFSLRSGVSLPLNTAIAASYEETTLDAIDQRGGHRSQFDRVWPNLQFSWSRIPLPAFLQTVILQSTVTAGFERSKQRSLLGGFAGQDRGGQEHRIPLSATISFPRGFALRYTGSLANGESDDPTGDAENLGRDHNLTLTGYIQIPESMKEKLRDPIQVNLSFREQSQRQCRFRELVGSTGTTGCVPFIDFRNRSLNFVLETTLSELRIGMNMSYTDRQSFVGTRNGNSQFQLGLFGNFEMKAGRDLGGGGLR
ncbi:MAG TPA: hypothetical protein VK864_09315, partial [Longimicrobiales bacterium]|nr:hypothetical protein [Longimicrobiales bacterium]